MFGGQIEVAVFVKDAYIDQLELRRPQSAPAIFINQSCVWIFRLRIFVTMNHSGRSIAFASKQQLRRQKKT